MVGLMISTVLADRPLPDQRYVKTSQGGEFVFTMVPAKREFRDKKWVIARDAFGICYSLTVEGELVEAWRVKGWFSPEIYLSDDGKHLIRMGPWSKGHEPEASDLAVAFYQNGKLLKTYSTADLVRRPGTILASVNHYEWLARARDAERGESNPDSKLRLEGNRVFHLKTCDLIKYQFDVTTGEIISIYDPLEEIMKDEKARSKNQRPTIDKDAKKRTGSEQAMDVNRPTAIHSQVTASVTSRAQI